MKKLYLMAMIATLLSACSSPKNVVYIQNSDYIDFSRSEVLYDARIMPKDILTITVNTVNPEASAPFNLIVASELNNSGGKVRLNTGGQTLQTYLVDNKGCIEFPVIGTLEVGGLTKSACEKLIHDKIQRFMNAEENPIVTVRMSNYKISVLGEVNKPGMFTVGNEKINIFEALAQAGDLTIYGVRDRVKLIRENERGHKDVYTLNLNDAEIINSPYYYLQQNDVIYVEPNKVKAKNSSIGQSTTIWISIAGALVSLASLVVNILR
jgi:polysaccharide export outer membrane protein